MRITITLDVDDVDYSDAALTEWAQFVHEPEDGRFHSLSDAQLEVDLSAIKVRRASAHVERQMHKVLFTDTEDRVLQIAHSDPRVLRAVAYLAMTGEGRVSAFSVPQSAYIATPEILQELTERLDDGDELDTIWAWLDSQEPEPAAVTDPTSAGSLPALDPTNDAEYGR